MMTGTARLKCFCGLVKMVPWPGRKEWDKMVRAGMQYQCKCGEPFDMNPRYWMPCYHCSVLFQASRCDASVCSDRCRRMVKKMDLLEGIERLEDFGVKI